jgi:hypothetical protein
MMEMKVFGSFSLVAYLMFGFSLLTWIYIFARGALGRRRRGFRSAQSPRQMVMARARWKFAY